MRIEVKIIVIILEVFIWLFIFIILLDFYIYFKGEVLLVFLYRGGNLNLERLVSEDEVGVDLFSFKVRFFKGSGNFMEKLIYIILEGRGRVSFIFRRVVDVILIGI